MSSSTKITLAKGGTGERTIEAKDIIIPDLWHIAAALDENSTVEHGSACADKIRECWHLCHDLRRHIQESP